MKISIKTSIGIIGIVAAIVWSVHGVNFQSLGAILSTIRKMPTIAVLILTTSNLIIRSMAWRWIVLPIKRVHLINAVRSYLVGVFSNLFLPFKLGDVAQGLTLGNKENISKITVVSAVIIQRIFEILSLILIMTFVTTVYSFPLLLRKETVILGLLILIAVIALFIIFKNRVVVLSWVEKRLEKVSPKIAHSAGNAFGLFLDGTGAIHDWGIATVIMFLSLLSWVVQISMVYLTAMSLNIELSLIGAGIVLLVINIGLVIPLAPGNIGTYQVFSILALSWFSVEKTRALSFAIIFQVIQGIPVIVGGGLSLVIDTLHNKKYPKQISKTAL